MTPHTQEETDAELIEKLAAIEHERWADWQKWCHKVLREQLNPNGCSNDLEDVLLRWDKQIATPYADLSEAEKQSDRDQVMRYWPLVQAHNARIKKQAEMATLDSLKYRMSKHFTNWGGPQGNCVPEDVLDEEIAQLSPMQPKEKK